MYLETKLLEYVRDVSEDRKFDSIEFNEFLEMISKHDRDALSPTSLVNAFRLELQTINRRG